LDGRRNVTPRIEQHQQRNGEKRDDDRGQHGAARHATTPHRLGGGLRPLGLKPGLGQRRQLWLRFVGEVIGQLRLPRESQERTVPSATPRSSAISAALWWPR
jgi:hypothetical protein